MKTEKHKEIKNIRKEKKNLRFVMLVSKAERNKQRYLIFIDVSTHSTKIIQEIKLFNQKE